MHRHVNAKQLERMKPSIVLLKNALEVNSIYNVDFEAIKQSFGYVTKAYEHLYYNPKDAD